MSTVMGIIGVKAPKVWTKTDDSGIRKCVKDFSYAYEKKGV